MNFLIIEKNNVEHYSIVTYARSLGFKQNKRKMKEGAVLNIHNKHRYAITEKTRNNMLHHKSEFPAD